MNYLESIFGYLTDPAHLSFYCRMLVQSDIRDDTLALIHCGFYEYLFTPAILHFFYFFTKQASGNEMSSVKRSILRFIISAASGCATNSSIGLRIKAPISYIRHPTTPLGSIAVHNRRSSKEHFYDGDHHGVDAIPADQ